MIYTISINEREREREREREKEKEFCISLKHFFFVPRYTQNPSGTGHLSAGGKGGVYRGRSQSTET